DPVDHPDLRLLDPQMNRDAVIGTQELVAQIDDHGLQVAHGHAERLDLDPGAASIHNFDIRLDGNGGEIDLGIDDLPAVDHQFRIFRMLDRAEIKSVEII